MGAFRQSIITVTANLKSALFPWDRCLCCGRRLRRNFPLCPECAVTLTDQRRCRLCGALIGEEVLWATKYPAAATVCRWCRTQKRPHVAEFLSVLPYEGRSRKHILQLKYHGRRGIAVACGELLAAAVKAKGWQPDLVVPVPLHEVRRRERGYNQAELIAVALASSLDLECVSALVRVKPTVTQHNLSYRERLANVKDAFAPGSEIESVRGKRVLLVDDIITSGATACACARVLRAAGASVVYAAAVGAPVYHE